MHSDQEAIKKSIRSYMIVGALLLVFTGITVAANRSTSRCRWPSRWRSSSRR